jgi:hypothetical protein
MDNAIFLAARRHRQAAVIRALEALAAARALADFRPAEAVAPGLLALLAGTSRELAGTIAGSCCCDL